MRTSSCCFSGCTHDAHWTPVLVLQDYAEQFPPARAELDIQICHLHRLAVSVKDVLTEKCWSNICREFHGKGREIPDRDSIQLDFKHLDHGFYC